mgnify:FL=1
MLAALFAKEENPAVTQPSVALTSSTAKAYEVGTSVTPAYSASLNPGNYQFGPATGITAKTWEVTATGVADTKTAATGTFDAITVADNTNYKITAKANFEAGAVPKTNLGNSYEAGKIAAGAVQATSAAISLLE